MKRKFSFSGFTVLLIMALCLLCPWIAPYDPYEIGASDPFLGPNRTNWFGTDDLGRDLLSRILYGGRITILVAIAATVIALIIGTAWGLAAGVRRGWLDEALMRTADATMAIPQILFGLVCISAVGASVVSLPIVVGVLLSHHGTHGALCGRYRTLLSICRSRSSIGVHSHSIDLVRSDAEYRAPVIGAIEYQCRRCGNARGNIEFYWPRHTTSQCIMGNLDASRVCKNLEHLLVCCIPSSRSHHNNFGL